MATQKKVNENEQLSKEYRQRLVSTVLLFIEGNQRRESVNRLIQKALDIQFQAGKAHGLDLAAKALEEDL